MISTSPEPRPQTSPFAIASAWCGVLCAVIAVGHLAWTRFGSGEVAASFDVVSRVPSMPAPGVPPAPAPQLTCASFGPAALSPEMNALRAVLYAGYVPAGSARGSYEIAMLDDAGRTVWSERGSIGNPDDDASFVATRIPLLDFEVDHAGPYTFEVSLPEGGADELRDARLEVRQGLAQVDPRITWGFGLAAVVCLLLALLAPKHEAYVAPQPVAGEQHREAA